MQFWKRAAGIALLGLGLCMGCGKSSGPETKVTKDQYTAVWGDVLVNYKKKKFEKKFMDEVLKKHSIDFKDWETANLAYGGMPQAVKAEYEKMMAIPMPKEVGKVKPQGQ